MVEEKQWHKVAESVATLQFNEKHIAPVMIGLKKICIAKVNGQLVAFTDVCPHAGASLSEGYIDAQSNITCCVHDYKFNLKTGRDTFNEGYFLKRYEIKIENEGVFVRM